MTVYKEEFVQTDHLLYAQLGKNVYKLRKQYGYTQEKLAEQIGSEQKQVSRIERGEAHPNLILCLKLANAFHVSVDTLLDGVVDREMVQALLNESSEQLLAQELLQVSICRRRWKLNQNCFSLTASWAEAQFVSAMYVHFSADVFFLHHGAFCPCSCFTGVLQTTRSPLLNG